MMHFMKLYQEPFSAIKRRTKDIELRLYDEKRKKVKVGDFITFTNVDTGEQITLKCVDIHLAASFRELFERLNCNVRFGFENYESTALMTAAMRKYYSEEDEEKYGVIGIELEHHDA